MPIALNTIIPKCLVWHTSILLCFLCSLDGVFLSTGFCLSNWPYTCWSHNRGHHQQRQADIRRNILQQGVMMKYYLTAKRRSTCFWQMKRYIRQSKSIWLHTDIHTRTKTNEAEVQSIISLLNNNSGPETIDLITFPIWILAPQDVTHDCLNNLLMLVKQHAKHSNKAEWTHTHLWNCREVQLLPDSLGTGKFVVVLVCLEFDHDKIGLVYIFQNLCV